MGRAGTIVAKGLNAGMHGVNTIGEAMERGNVMNIAAQANLAAHFAAAPRTSAALRAPLRAAHFLSENFMTPLFAHHAKNRWEQSVGIGHLLTIVPHTLVAATGISAAHQHAARGRHATNTMPSNSPQYQGA